MWWVNAKLRREGLSYMPPSVVLRKEAHDAPEAASRAKSEAEVRQLIADVNEKIREANRKGIRGPSLMLMPFDVEQVVRDWREQHSREDTRSPRGDRTRSGCRPWQVDRHARGNSTVTGTVRHIVVRCV